MGASFSFFEDCDDSIWTCQVCNSRSPSAPRVYDLLQLGEILIFTSRTTQFHFRTQWPQAQKQSSRRGRPRTGSTHVKMKHAFLDENRVLPVWVFPTLGEFGVLNLGRNVSYKAYAFSCENVFIFRQSVFWSSDLGTKLSKNEQEETCGILRCYEDPTTTTIKYICGQHTHAKTQIKRVTPLWSWLPAMA